MSGRKLILTPFRKALATLDEALRSREITDIVRDATIQRFEYTYELAWKMIKRHLTWMGEPQVREFSKRQLFRKAGELGLIDDPERWFGFNEARNQTSHSYNLETAKEVYESAREFAPAARRLLERLEAAHD